MTHLQLHPTIPLDTDHGPADAHFLIDYGSEAPLLFVVFVRTTGECWTLDARKCRLEKNVTGGVRVSGLLCECINWAREASSNLSEHHPNCTQYVREKKKREG